MLKPIRHVHEIADLSSAEAETMGPALRNLIGAMRAALGTERIDVCSFAETVQHLHFHLIPRDADMPALGPNLLPDLFGERWACSIPEAEDAAALIRTALAG